MSVKGVTGNEGDGINRNSAQRHAYNTHLVVLTLCSDKVIVQNPETVHNVTFCQDTKLKKINLDIQEFLFY